jgi:PleD family two-component response regulator
MMTHTVPNTTTDTLTVPPAAQKVAIVNGSTDTLELLETVLSAGQYDIVFVESSDHAYSHIKSVQPDLVILCMQIEDTDGFQILSMLKLDDETRRIPVLTYTTEYEGQEADDADVDAPDLELFAAPKPALPMN